MRAVHSAGGLPPAPAEPADAAVGPLLGAYAGSLERVRLEALAPGMSRGRRLLRGKRWRYVLLASDQILAGLAVMEAGLYGGAFAWAVDRARGTLLFERSAAGLPGLGAHVAPEVGPGASARFSGPSLRLSIARDARWWWIRARARGVALDATLDAGAAPAPLVLVAPVPGGGARVTQKSGAHPLGGGLVVQGRRYALDGGTGAVDTTFGLLARETSWRWACGTGRGPGGAPLAFNLCDGFAGVPAGSPGENAVLCAGGPWPAPPCAFAFDPAAPLAPWRVASADGRVALTFQPLAAHREARDLGLLRSRFVQVAGEFTGHLPGPGGAPLELAGLPGVVEDHWARW